MENDLTMTKLNLYYHSSWLLTRVPKKLGFFGLLALSITLGCCLFYAMVILPLNTQINLIQQQLLHVKSDEIIFSSEQELPVKDQMEDIAKFKQLLPQANTLHHWLALIDKSAFKQGLKLNKGDYKFTQVKQLQIASNQYPSSYEIVLPVTGQYQQIRQFIDNVLLLQPALALGNIKIRRDSSLSSIVDARLVFVLFLQGDSL